MTVSIERGLILLRQRRYDMAADRFRQALSANPNSPEGHALLALCLLEQEKFDEATREARTAVELAPDHASSLAVLARVYYMRNYLDEAEDAVRRAIRLEPETADHHSLLGAIRLNRRDWAGALRSAEDALRVDPEHTEANNLRAMALVKLGRRGEAGATIGATLAREPEDAMTHANQGWALLHGNEPKRALEHFREALRLDPEMDWARQGIVEALKARNPIYRVMLMYFLWMSRLSGRTQWVLIVGGYFGFKGLQAVARANPDVAPLVWPLLIAYVLFVLLCWTSVPLFNLLLRLNKFGRLVLSDEQQVASNWLGGTILLAVVLVAAGALLQQPRVVAAGIVAALMIIPVTGVWHCPQGWPRKFMSGYAIALGGLGLLSVALLDFGPGRSRAEGAGLMTVTLFGIGVFFATWVANFLMMQQPKR